MQSFIEKSIEHIKRIFPSIYESRVKKSSFHFSFAYSRNKLIAIGLNQPEKVNAKAYYLAKKLNLQDKLLYPFIHSEENLVGRLIGMGKLSTSLNIVVLRLNRFHQLGESEPCSNCKIILKAYGLNKIYWSNRNGEICS